MRDRGSGPSFGSSPRTLGSRATRHSQPFARGNFSWLSRESPLTLTPLEKTGWKNGGGWVGVYIICPPLKGEDHRTFAFARRTAEEALGRSRAQTRSLPDEPIASGCSSVGLRADSPATASRQ